MTGWAVAALAAWGLLVFGLRTVVALRDTGDSGMRAITSPPGQEARDGGGVLFGAGRARTSSPGRPTHGVGAQLSDRRRTGRGRARYRRRHDHRGGPAIRPRGRWLGAGGVVNSHGRGAAEHGLIVEGRVNPDEETELITSGLFAVVRNPIFRP